MYNLSFVHVASRTHQTAVAMCIFTSQQIEPPQPHEISYRHTAVTLDVDAIQSKRWHSSVYTVTRLGLSRPMHLGSIPGTDECFPLSTKVKSDSDAHPDVYRTRRDALCHALQYRRVATNSDNPTACSYQWKTSWCLLEKERDSENSSLKCHAAKFYIHCSVHRDSILIRSNKTHDDFGGMIWRKVIANWTPKGEKECSILHTFPYLFYVKSGGIYSYQCGLED